MTTNGAIDVFGHREPCARPDGHLADHACPCGHYWMIHSISGECPACRLIAAVSRLEQTPTVAPITITIAELLSDQLAKVLWRHIDAIRTQARTVRERNSQPVILVPMAYPPHVVTAATFLGIPLERGTVDTPQVVARAF